MDQIKQSQKSFPERPPTFEFLMHQVKLNNYVEPLDGLKVELGLALSPHLQFSNAWALHPNHPGVYSFHGIFAGGELTNPAAGQPNPLMMGRYEPSTGRQDIRFMYKWN